MGEVYSCGPTAPGMMASGLMGKRMDQVDSYTPMAMSMKAVGRMALHKAKESFQESTETNILANSKTTSSMAMAKKRGQMGPRFKDFTRMA